MGNEATKDQKKYEGGNSDILNQLHLLETEAKSDFFQSDYFQKILPATKDQKKREEGNSDIPNQLHLLETGTESDLTLECVSQKFRVHSRVLPMHSDVFRMLIDELAGEKRILITNIGPFALEKLLHYLYSGEVPSMSAGNAMKLYEAAEIYQVDSLIEKCTDVIKEKLNENNVCDVLVFSNSRRATYLKDATIKYLVGEKSFLLSECWRRFCEIHPNLATEVHLAFIRSV